MNRVVDKISFSCRYKSASLFLLLIVFSLGCEPEELIPLIDPTTSVIGVVIDSMSSLQLDSVIVGWKVHSYPDSLLFPADTLNFDSIKIGVNIREIGRTKINGQFRFDFFLAPLPPYPYEDMFAYKQGYLPWRFNPQRDNVIRINQYADSLNIRLVPK